MTRFLAFSLGLLALAARAATPAPVAELIRSAGNTSDERERFRLLRALEARSDLDAPLRADLAKLLPVVDDWANGKARAHVDDSRAAENGYLCRFITGRVHPSSAAGPVHPPELSPGSPLRPIWATYRGRMLLWRVIQSGPLLRVKETRDLYYGEARRLLQEASQAFPENRVLRMYLGQPIPWPARAPKWSSSCPHGNSSASPSAPPPQPATERRATRLGTGSRP